MSDQTAPQPQIKITWLIGTLAALAIFAVIGGYSSRMTLNTTDYDQDRAAQRYLNLKKVQADENALLYPAVDKQGQAHAVWVDQTKGLIRLPIDEAMAAEVDTLKAQPAAVGCEIPGTTPAPAPTPAAAPATTNAAPIKPAAPAAKKPATSTAKPTPSNK